MSDIESRFTLEAAIATARPRLIKGVNDRAILLLHGWTGYPGQLYYLGEVLNKTGYTVAIPRLPGHGTSGPDLLRTDGTDWLHQAEESYRELSRQYNDIVVAGVSMGALLALALGATGRPSGLILAAPAIAVKDRSAHLATWLHRIIPEITVTLEGESSDPDEEFMRREYWSKRRLKSVADLLRLQRRVRRLLPGVTAPLLILETRRDEMVAQGAATRISRRVASQSIRQRLFTESKHQLFNGCEREAVAVEILNWLSTLPQAELKEML